MATPESATAPASVGSPRRSLATVVAVVFVDLLGFGVVVPILPYYVRSFGVSDVFIGLLAASYSLAQFLAAPTLGRLSDERGRRPVLLLSMAGSALAWTVFGLATAVGTAAGTVAAVATLFGARTVAGAMGGNVAAAQAYVADVTPPERRAAALGLVGAAFGLGFVFGPALGGLLASPGVVAAADALFPPVVPTTPYTLPSFGAAALSLLAFGFAAVALEEPPRERGADAPRRFVDQFRDALADVALRPYVLSFFLLAVAFSGVQVMFIPFAADAFGYDETGTALLLTYVGALGVLNQGLVVGRLSRRVGDARIAVGGAGLLVVALAALPAAPVVGDALSPGGPAWLTGRLLALLAVLGLLSVGNGLLSVALSALVSAAAPAERQGVAFGVTQGVGSLGRTVGPPAMAALYVLARPAPFLFGALLVVPAVALLAAARSTDTG
jgi:MFS family permease